MQSASQGEPNTLARKDLPDGTTVVASLLCRHVRSHLVHNPKDPYHSEESKPSEHLSLCRFTLDQSHFSLWCPVSSSPAPCSYMPVTCNGTEFFCAVGHYYHFNNEDCAASAHAVIREGQPTVAGVLERQGYKVTRHIPAGDRTQIIFVTGTHKQGSQCTSPTTNRPYLGVCSQGYNDVITQYFKLDGDRLLQQSLKWSGNWQLQATRQCTSTQDCSKDGSDCKHHFSRSFSASQLS